ncbi:cytochrome d ubiquinol oxidase subunit II [Roseiconus lacunae]|uniref:Cytochrome d ubiquinol oxidase subunit II n=1 Tax=Roseiconus lacunae TaxID=2605694 RepID=A0ABT7PKK6_9BACT|nr:cytochrome d ubiquinol oxidase subunit II [Roseiconus lacunae]MCD0461094.1 cytochrome d ubiquinol oxidase subunit II [Roseiconus lacunae]MDM4016998.1 cytochrome d ubiquinol oxidase subunit II [Roseiconus lacunae]WRQ48931.1 cytochrome d ubiquinol oxidase subunit II [Stieleria sp. HD01]
MFSLGYFEWFNHQLLSYDTLTHIWFLLLGVLITGYAILDGFDLGVGMLHPFIAKDDRERRLVMNSIGPLWDGNEVWLVTFGGALFAAFPNAYATVFSSFYTAFFLLLTCLIGRAVSLEFRSKVHEPVWRRFWDFGFFLSSFTAALLLGIAGGNIMAGMELGAKFHYEGSLLSQVYWYPLLVGAMTTSLFALHGAIYLYLKTEDELQARVKRVILPLFFVFCGVYTVVSIATWWHVPHATDNLFSAPMLWIVPVLNFFAVLNIPRAMHLGRPGYAFFTSTMVIAALACLFSVAIFPNLMLSNLADEYTITIYNGRSSHQTLWTMLVIAIIGIPCVLSYTVVIYWIFRGKVQLDPNSY